MKAGTANNSPESPSGETVFFSYSRQDQNAALPIIQAIEDAGYKVWWDGMLEGGTAFLDTTEQALENAKAVVVLWSERSINSHWVRDEATIGRERNRIIPLTLDGTLPPLGFRQVQIIDMQNWQQNAEAFADLSRALAKLHDRDFTPPDLHISSRIMPAVTAPARATGLSRRTALSGAAGLGLFAALGLAGTWMWRRGQNAPGDTSLVVMPFENTLADTDFAYLAQGLSSSVRDQLAMNSAMRVVARSSSQALARDGLATQDIAKRLSVAHVLEGRLERIDSKLQVTASLVDARTGFARWVERLTYRQNGVIELRDRIIALTVGTLAANQQGQDKIRIGSTDNPEAFMEYMKGDTVLAEQATLDSVRTARRHFERATTLDPRFAKAHAGLAQLYLVLGSYDPDPVLKTALLEQSEVSARKATALAPNDAESFAGLGYVLMIGSLDLAGAGAPFREAGRLGLHTTNGFARYATYLSCIGRHADAISQAQQAMQLDPLDPAAAETLGFAYYAARQYDEAIEAFRLALSFNPERFTTRARLGTAKILSGDVQDGLAICREEANLLERYPCEAAAAMRSDDETHAQSVLNQLIEQYGDAGAYQQAQIEAQMGRYDEAIQTLLKAETLMDTGLVLAKIDPMLDSLKNDARFEALLVRLGLSD